MKYTIWRSYFSFIRGEKAENSELFKDFFNEVESEKNETGGVLYLIIVPYLWLRSIIAGFIQ